MTTITTVVGPAHVMHRLALGVEAIDAVRNGLIENPARVGREVAPTLGGTPDFPCIRLSQSGTGRFTLNRTADVPNAIRLRIDDPARRLVARRFDLTLWPSSATDGIDETPPVGNYVPVASRLLRAWLLPGSAALLPRGTTAIRGRIARNGVPVRWPRIRAHAVANANVLVGWAHGDDRGEFLLVITDTAVPPPLDDSVDVTLTVTAPPPPTQVPDPNDRLADLVVEVVPRSAAPPGPNDLDNDLLRGRVDPPGYGASAGAKPTISVPVGELLTLTAGITFND